MGKRNLTAKKGETPVNKKEIIPVASPKSTHQSSAVSGYMPALVCVFLGIYYWITYSNTEGLYQHDEVAHLIDMLFFWDHPLDTLVGLWSRGGYKILYCLSALGGEQAIVFTNILFTCGTAWVTYRIAETYGSKHSWLVILLFGLQPFIINLSFRCYAEVPTMFFSALLVFLYVKKKYIWAAIVVSFLFTLRQEMAVFAMFLGIFFLLKRKWLPLLLLAWAPLVLSILGWIKTGNALYIVDSVLQGGVTDTYQRNGFFYLWLMLPEIVGALVVVLFISGYISLFTGTKKLIWQNVKKFHAVLLLFTVYFLMHCIFTSKSFGFGRSGGLGRFLIVVSPFIALIALAGFNYFSSLAVKTRYRLAVLGVSYAIIIIFLFSLKSILPKVFNSFTVMIMTKENFLFLFVSAIILLLLVILKPQKTFAYAVMMAGLLFLSILVTVKPLERGAEDETMKYMTEWYWNSPYAQRPVHTGHILFTYYSLQNGFSKDHVAGFDSLSVVNARKGELFLYENHYSYKNVSSQLLDKSGLSLVKEFNLPGSYFAAYLLEKK